MIKLKAVVSSALDCHTELTVPASTWFGMSDGHEDRKWREMIFERAERLAVNVLHLSGQDDDEHREGESRRVGYSPTADAPFFLFKFDNNGTTVVVSEEMIDVKDKVDVLGRSCITE